MQSHTILHKNCWINLQWMRFFSVLLQSRKFLWYILLTSSMLLHDVKWRYHQICRWYTTLLVGLHSSLDIIREYDNICAWSARNKLTINTNKTKEIFSIGLPLGISIFRLLCLALSEFPSYITWNWHHLYSLNCCVRKQDATAHKPAFVPLVTAQVARHDNSGPTSVIYWSYHTVTR